MNAKKINNIWVIRCYNQISFVTDAEGIDSEMDFHDHIKERINNYLDDDNRKDCLFVFFDYRYISFIYNAVKAALYQGIIEQPFEVYSDDESDTIIIKIDNDSSVSIIKPTDEPDCFVEVMEPISLDVLECMDSKYMMRLSEEITEQTAEEFESKVTAIRSMLTNPVADSISDAELSLIFSEGVVDKLM